MSLRRALPALLAAAVLITAPPAGNAQEDDAFFEADFDGAWIGTIASGKDRLPLQVMLNLAGNASIGTIFAFDDDAALTAFSPVFGRVQTKKVTVSYEPVEGTGPAAARVATTLVLKYKAADDTVAGNSKGAVRGRVSLVRMDPDLPVQRLWQTSIKVGGDDVAVLLQLEETPADAAPGGRFAVDAVTGHAWVGDEQGPVEGTRNGAVVDLTIDLPSGEATLETRLKRRNGQLKGSAELPGGKSKIKLVPAGSVNGKPMKVGSVVGGEVHAGDTGIVGVKGRNFGVGTLVHADNPDVEILGVDLVSPKRLDVVVQAGSTVAAGTEIALRVINGDGQAAERARAFTVTEEDGGGGGGGVSFASDVQPILSTNCATAGCHSSSSAQEGLVLASGSALANLVNVPSRQRPEIDRVEPGDPNNSYLVQKIRGDAGIQGSRMPLDRAALTAAQIDTIVAWIQAGAPSNGPDGE